MKRGQIQALEPIMIVIILAVIAGVGIFMYARATESNMRAQSQVASAQEDTELLAKVARMPELSCSRDRSQTNCIDLEKANSFSELMKDSSIRLKYFPLFGAAKITIERIGSGTSPPVVVYDGMRGTEIRATRTYFTIYDPATKTTDFAVMVVEREP